MATIQVGRSSTKPAVCEPGGRVKRDLPGKVSVSTPDACVSPPLAPPARVIIFPAIIKLKIGWSPRGHHCGAPIATLKMGKPIPATGCNKYGKEIPAFSFDYRVWWRGSVGGAGGSVGSGLCVGGGGRWFLRGWWRLMLVVCSCVDRALCAGGKSDRNRRFGVGVALAVGGA
jgi:hypothetical protein